MKEKEKVIIPIYTCELTLKREGQQECFLDKDEPLRNEDFAEIFRKIPNFVDCSEEKAIILAMSPTGEVVGIHEISHGTKLTCTMDSADIFKKALLNNASAIFIAHNHPHGELKFSPRDIKCTKKLIEAGSVLSIKVMNHFIFSPNGDFVDLHTHLQNSQANREVAHIKNEISIY